MTMRGRRRSKKSLKSAYGVRDHFGERSRGKYRRAQKGVSFAAIELIRRWSGGKDRAEYEQRRISSFEVERQGQRWCSDSHTVPMATPSMLRLSVMAVLGLLAAFFCCNALWYYEDWQTHLAIAWMTVLMMVLIDRYAEF